MKKSRITSIILIFLLIASTATCAFASTPKDLTPPQAAEQLDTLNTTLGNKYFTTTGKSYSNSDGDTCNMGQVIKAAWFKTAVNNKIPTTTSTSETFLHYYNGSTLTRGWSCCGFANYAEWYLFAQQNADTVKVKEIEFVKFNKSNMQKYAQIGDVIRLGNSTSGGAHSAILYSIADDYIYVIDSNWGYTNKVTKHKINYSAYTYVGISRAQNYDYATGYYTIKASNTLNMRDSSSSSGALLTKVPTGTVVKVTETEKNWGKYQYNGITGWSNMDYMTFNGTYVNEVSFDAGGGTGTMEPFYYDVGTGFNAPASKFKKDGYKFIGWYLKNEDLNEWRCKNKETGKMAWLKESEMTASDEIFLYPVNQISNLASRYSNSSKQRLYAQWKKLVDIKDLNVKLESGTYFCDGTEKTPAVTIPNLTNGKDYTVTYIDNVLPGTATIIINGIGEYIGTVVRTFNIELEAPEPSPANVAASGKIKLTWPAVPGADHYEIYRAASSSGIYKKMYTTSKTTYTNTSAEAGKMYYYKVKAICDAEASVNSAFSAKVSRRCDLARPVVKSSLTSSKAVKLTWAKIEGADRYKIYRSTSKNGTYKNIFTTTNCNFTNKSVTKGKTYYYKVKAIYDANTAANSAYSTIVSKKVQ